LTFDLDIRTRARFLYNAPNAKFHHPTLNRLEVRGRTNKQTDATENIDVTSLRYATPPVGKYQRVGSVSSATNTVQSRYWLQWINLLAGH